jgi:uncharacterized protein YlxW (UPF0749 family)
MTTLSDWESRYNRLNAGIDQVQKLVESYTKNNRATKDLVQAVDSLKKRKATLDSKEKDYEQAAATFDRDFLERKSDFPEPFKADKLYTIQDFILFFFFISYCIFVVALSLTFRSSQGKILGGGFVLLLLIFALIIRYA